MLSTERTITRRQMLRSGAAGAAGLGVSGAVGKLLTGALASGPSQAPPGTPRWHTRPDLQIPALTVTRREPGASSDPIFIAPYNAPTGQVGAVIVAADGQPIWEHPLSRNVVMNFQTQSYRGSPVLTWWEGEIAYGHGIGEYVIADAGYRTVRRVQAARGLHGDLHEFVITPRDTALLTSYAITQADLRAVGGPRHGTIQDAIFQEIDLASGALLLEWHSLAHIPLTESYSPVEADWDFFHINSVDFDHDGNLLVSARSTHTVYKIARDGSILWRLGGKRSDFQMGPGTEFAWQHHARRQSEGTLTVFDNGSTPAVERLSRGLILDLDEPEMTATLVHQYTHPRVLSGSQGSVQLLPNGNVFVGWGETPRITEFDRTGHVLFDAVLGKQYECYRAFRLPWSGRPAEAPAIALGGSRRGGRSVYASWNGATDVHIWQLFAGERRDTLAPAGSARADGFETTLHTHAAGPCFAVQALDATGAPLGRSEALAATS